jgi:succinate dehydrogenase / fumarate reductase cytochrome b subunit
MLILCDKRGRVRPALMLAGRAGDAREVGIVGWLGKILGSTVGQKVIVGLTGLALFLFVLIHLVENLMVMGPNGGQALNEWAAFLHSLPILPLLEIGLFSMLLIHIGLTVKLTRANLASRGSRYASTGTKRTDKLGVLASRTMPISGVIVLAFLALHIWDFRLDREGTEAVGGISIAIGNKLAVGWRAAIYMVGVSVIAWHLSHGIQSAFRSFGVNHSKWTPVIVKAGSALALIIGIGFVAIPLWALFIR